MNSVFSFGRCSVRQIRSTSKSFITRPRQTTFQRSLRSFNNGARNSNSRNAHHGTKVLWATAAALSPAAFIRLSEKDNEGTELTAEARMLEASREEIEKKLSDDDHGISRVRHGIVLYLDLYLWEPLCTTFRFFHLVIIFVPLIVSIPALWIGSRDPKRDNERSGTLWWYSFLVKSMERAGPAFIKVKEHHNSDVSSCS